MWPRIMSSNRVEEVILELPSAHLLCLVAMGAVQGPEKEDGEAVCQCRVEAQEDFQIGHLTMNLHVFTGKSLTDPCLLQLRYLISHTRSLISYSFFICGLSGPRKLSNFCKVAQLANGGL